MSEITAHIMQEAIGEKFSVRSADEHAIIIEMRVTARGVVEDALVISFKMGIDALAMAIQQKIIHGLINEALDLGVSVGIHDLRVENRRLHEKLRLAMRGVLDMDTLQRIQEV